MTPTQKLNTAIKEILDIIILDDLLHDDQELLNYTISSLTKANKILMSRYIAATSKGQL